MSSALIFTLEKELFALPLSSVTEVLRAAWPLRSPRAPFGCLGVLDVRGQLVPLVDTAALLGLRRFARAQVLLQRLVDSHVLLLNPTPNTVGLLVDQVVDVGEASSGLTEADKQQAQSLGRTPQLVTGLATAQGRRALLLDPSILVGERRQKLLRRTVQSSLLEGR